LCYIDSFAQLICWPSQKTGRNFITAISDFGGDPILGLVHPLNAARIFRDKKPPWKDLAAYIQTLFPGPNYELLTDVEFLSRITPCFTSNAIGQKQVSNELWQATMASVIYNYFRNPAIHRFCAGPDLSFSATTYRGAPVADIDFDALYSVAQNLHAELIHRSKITGKFCGNDDILYA